MKHEMYKPITVSGLKKLCNEAMKMGYGNREIYVATDDEGNFFRPMFYGFTANEEDLGAYLNMGCIDDDVKVDEIILLG